MTATRRQKWISLLLAAIPAVVAVLLYLLLPLFPGFTETVMTAACSVRCRCRTAG